VQLARQEGAAKWEGGGDLVGNAVRKAPSQSLTPVTPQKDLPTAQNV
jgi:hypothetical protein